MPIDLSQPVRLILQDLITQLEVYTPPTTPTGTVITGGVNILTITSLEDLPALTAAGGVNSITVSLATPAGTVITGGTNSLTVTSLEPVSALSATGGTNSITVGA